MSNMPSVSPTLEKISATSNSTADTHTIDEIYALCEEWLESMEFSPDYFHE